MARRYAAAQITLQRIARFILVTLFIVALAFSSGQTSQAVSQLGTVWRAHLDIPAVTATMGDLTGDGLLELIVATAERVYIYKWDDATQRYIEHIHVGGFPAKIATLAVADHSGTGRDDLWIGMEGSGSIQIYSLQGQALVSRGTVGRLWSSVAELLPTDIDGNGLIDLLALSEEGTSVLFYNTGETFQTVWRTPTDEDPDRFVAVGHYMDNQLPTVITAKGQGRLSMYEWQQHEPTHSRPFGTLVQRYENYPWGAIGAMDLVSGANPNVADLYVATSQGLLYQYGWRGAESRHLAQWPQHLVGSVAQLKALDTPAVMRPTWISLDQGTLRAWELSSTGLQSAWELPETTLWFEQTSTGHLIAFSEDQSLRIIGPVANGFVRVERDGKGHVLIHPALIDDGQVFLAAQDFAEILSLRAWTTRNGTRFNGVASFFKFFIVDAESATASVNGRTKNMEHAPRLVEEILYLPLSFADALGFKYDWFAPLRHLTFH